MEDTKRKVNFELPWPPSVNRYLRRKNAGCHTTESWKAFQKEVTYLCLPFRNKFVNGERLKAKILAFPPDNRKRDLDNLLKALFDSLQKAQVFSDDEQIDFIQIVRQIEKTGSVQLTISEL